MITVTVASQKGGSGKSTLSRHGSVLLPNAVLMDLDPQHTTRNWLVKRHQKGIVTPRAIIADPHRVPEAVAKAGELGAEWMVIDTPPEHDDQRAIVAGVRAADYVLIPCKPSPDDMEVISHTIRLTKNANKPFGVVMTMTRRSRYDEGACKFIEGLVTGTLGDFCQTRVVNRVTYVESVHQALSVTEYDASSKAAEEMTSIWAWVKARAEAAVRARNGGL